MRILLDAGIAMNLAVSLNIVSGLTGQFSMGHAGFMACGGYVAAFITYYSSMLLWGSAATHGGLFGVGAWMFVGGLHRRRPGCGRRRLSCRFAFATVARRLSGHCHARLWRDRTRNLTANAAGDRRRGEGARGDLSNFFPPPVGGSEGFFGVPKYTNMFWVYAFLTVTVVASYRIKQSGLGRAMISVREDDSPHKRWGSTWPASR